MTAAPTMEPTVEVEDGARWRRLLRPLSEPLYTQTYYLMANTLVVAGSGFAFWAVAARLSTPSTIGIGSSLIGAVMLLALVSRLGLDVGLLRALSSARDDDASAVVTTAFCVSGLVAALSAVIFLAGLPAWNETLLRPLSTPHAKLLFVLITVTFTVGTLIDSVLIARRRAGWALAKNSTHSVLKVALTIIIIPLGALGILISALGSIVLASLLVWPSWRRELRRRDIIGTMGTSIRRLISASLPNYVVAFLLAAPLPLGSLLVLEWHGASNAGIFYVIWMIGSVSLIGPTAFGQTILVEMSGGVRRMGWMRGLGISTGGGLAALTGGVVLLPLFGADYTQWGLWPFVPFALAPIPGFIFHALLARSRARDCHAAVVVGALAMLTVFVIGLAVLPEGQVAMSGWILLGSLIGGATATYATAGRFTPTKLDKSSTSR